MARTSAGGCHRHEDDRTTSANLQTTGNRSSNGNQTAATSDASVDHRSAICNRIVDGYVDHQTLNVDFQQGVGLSSNRESAVLNTDKMVWRRRDSEPASTEGSLRALLNKLAPSDSLGSLANQVASHLLEDDAPEQLARQLVERAQIEPLFAATYAKLCSVLVRFRSGFIFYKHLLTRCRSTFGAAVRDLILEPDSAGYHCDAGTCPPASSASSSSLSLAGAVANCDQHLHQRVHRALTNDHQFGQRPSSGYPSRADLQRHRLMALVVFLCQLFLEGLVCFEQLQQDFLEQLQCQLPDHIALECLCSALNTAGRYLEEQRPQWLAEVLRQLQEALHLLQQQDRQLRMTFMVKDLVELHQRNWQPREIQTTAHSPMEQAEP